MRYYGLALLKGMSAFGIVGCHLFLAPMTNASKYLLHFCDLGVALFGAMSGFFLLMGYERKYVDGFSALALHKAKRIIPAYAFWTIVYLVASPVFNLVVRHKTIDSRYLEPKYWIEALFLGGSSTHLWYLAYLFWWSVILYLLWEGYRLFRRPFVLVVLSMASLLVCVCVGGVYCDYGLRLFVFMTLGAAIHGVSNLWRKLSAYLLMALMVVSLLAHIILPFHAYIRDYIATLAIIPFFAQINATNRIIALLSDLSFGIYLIHPLLTMFFSILCLRLFGTPTSVVVLIIDWVVVFIVCSIIVLSLKKCRFLEWIVR